MEGILFGTKSNKCDVEQGSWLHFMICQSMWSSGFSGFSTTAKTVRHRSISGGSSIVTCRRSPLVAVRGNGKRITVGACFGSRSSESAEGRTHNAKDPDDASTEHATTATGATKHQSISGIGCYHPCNCESEAVLCTHKSSISPLLLLEWFQKNLKQNQFSLSCLSVLI